MVAKHDLGTAPHSHAWDGQALALPPSGQAMCAWMMEQAQTSLRGMAAVGMAVGDGQLWFWDRKGRNIPWGQAEGAFEHSEPRQNLDGEIHFLWKEFQNDIEKLSIAKRGIWLLADGGVLQWGSGRCRYRFSPTMLETLGEPSMLSAWAAAYLRGLSRCGAGVVLSGPLSASIACAAEVWGKDLAAVWGGGLHTSKGICRVESLGHAQILDAAPTLALGLPPAETLLSLMQSRSCVGHIFAYDLSTTLMRLETAASFVATHDGGLQPPLAILAGIQAVVCVGDSGVEEIAEVSLAADGYSIQPVFGRHRAGALAVCGRSGWLSRFERMGLELLAEDLNHAALSVESAVQPSTASNISKIDVSIDHVPQPTAQFSVSKPMEGVHAPKSDMPAWKTAEVEAVDQAAEDLAPGWELECSEEAEIAETFVAKSSQGHAQRHLPASDEDRELAARHGLAPPPKPTSLS